MQRLFWSVVIIMYVSVKSYNAEAIEKRINLLVPTEREQQFEVRNSADEDCEPNEKVAKLMCVAVHSLLKHNEKLSKHICNCGTSFLLSDPSYCQSDNYDFKDAPACGKLFKSSEFRKDINNPTEFKNFITNFVFKKMFKVCKEKNDKKLAKYAELVFKPGPVGNAIEAVMKEKPDYLNCYNEFKKIAHLRDD